jgi:radical S-adenosyl methionine domain-containing protein 2
MKSSYLILDEEMRFLDKGDGEETYSESILKVGVEEALKNIRFDEEEFLKRKGDYLFQNEITNGKCVNNRELKALEY